MTVTKLNKVYSITRDMIDVTCLSRPDTSWKYIDRSGHVHRWYEKGRPATKYYPTAIYTTPTLVCIYDGAGYYEEGEGYNIDHMECRLCGEPIEPVYTADTINQYMKGLSRYSIDGVLVSREEFKKSLLDDGVEFE